MAHKYLLIESRDPFASREVGNDYSLARALAAAGDETTVFLIQNGVLAARAAARDDDFQLLLESGAAIVCDEFSLRERGIYSEEIAGGVEVGPLDIVVDHLVSGSKVVWL